MLFGLTRLLLFFYIGVAAIESGVRLTKHSLKAVSVSDGKDTQNLCSGAVFLTIRKVLAIAGAQRLLNRRN